MSLRFIYGRAGSGKSHFCLNDIKARINEGTESPLILLVPEQFSLQAERKLIKTLGTGGIMKAEVLSFRRLSHRIFSEVGGKLYPHINSACKSMIIYKILEKYKENFKVFSKASNQNGFIKTISDTITEFKRYNITSLDLDKLSKSMDENSLLRQKLSELNLIYSEFEKAITEKYRDADDELTLLSEKLKFSNQFNGAEIWIDEFSGFTPQENMVIGKLLEKAKRVNLSICTDCLIDEGSNLNLDVFSTVKSEVKKLTSLANDRNITVEHPVILNDEVSYRFKENAELLHLEKNYYAFPYKKYELKTKNISIFSSVNIYAEIENTARDILKLCREDGLRFKDIAVISGNLGAYEKFVKVIFAEYGIPFFIDKKIDINTHPVIQLITSMFDIFNTNWAYEAVFCYLKTGLTGINRENIDIIENYVLACGIRGSKWTQEESWNYKTQLVFETDDEEIKDDEEYLKINKIRMEIAAPLIAFREKTKGRRKAREICSALFEFLCEIGIPERIEESIEQFRQNGQLIIAQEYGQVFNILIEMLDKIVEVLGEENIGIEKFSNILKVGFGEYKIGLIPPSIDQVLVGNAERSKNHEVKAIYLLGVNDGIFPAAHASEGILSDSDREFIKASGIEIANSSRSKVFEEQFLIYTTLTTAKDYLKISYPIADNEGRTLRPSIVVSRLKKIFPNIHECSNIINDDSDLGNVELVSCMNPTFNYLVSNMRKGYEGTEIKPVWWDVYRLYCLSDEWKKKCEIAKKALSYTNHVKAINKEKINKLYGSSIQSSVSRFEKYAACPFSYYVQYGLKARERKVYRLNPPDIGTFMHTVIERFSRLILTGEKTWREIDYEWCSAVVSEIVEDMLQNMKGSIISDTKRYSNLARRLKRVLVRAVWLIAEHIKRSSFNPIGYEVQFGGGGEFPAINIELSSGEKISLTGRIDRIDALKTAEGTYLRIIDYKSGSKSFKLSDVFYGMQIQLITYLDAIGEVEREDLKKPILPGGMLYFKIDDPIIKSNKKINEEDVEREIIKQLKMKGLLIADVKIIKEMDNQIEGYSSIIPARLNKGDELGRSSAATVEQFEALRKYVKQLLSNMGDEMARGEFPIKPFKNKRSTSCSYCEYSSICQFDTVLKDNKFKIINDKNEDEVWSSIRQSQLKTPADDVSAYMDKGGEDNG